MPLHPGLVVSKEEIGSFLASHKEDLEQVHGFFAAFSPIVRIGLAIHVTAEGRIAIEPKRNIFPASIRANVRFYGDFAYVEGPAFQNSRPRRACRNAIARR